MRISVPTFFGTIVLASCFILASIVSADAPPPPQTPSPAAPGNSGNTVTQNSVGTSGTSVVGNWGESGAAGSAGTDAPFWTIEAGELSVYDEKANDGAPGVVGGSAGQGGAGGNLTIGV
ncbi:MAG: hypothetical protein LBK06_05110, partial [Planctomycetaceae bacterium]|nr:hypothetical protein [Planctomycetaceae bacterium]